MKEIERIEGWAQAAAPAAPDPAAEADDAPAADLTTQVGVLASGYAAAAEAPGAAYYEEFLAKKGLLAEAKRFVRIRAQLDELGKPVGSEGAEEKLRGLVVSAPIPNFSD